jgi:tetratricopeptide (TPR) repeat protein
LLLLLVAIGPERGGASADEPLERARAALAAGRLWPAEQAAREAVALEPESAVAYQLLGRVLARRLHWDEALAAFEQARRLDPDRPRLDREIGRVHFAREDYVAAAIALRRAAQREPDDDALALELGLCELALGELEAAIAALEQAARNPDLAQVALYNLGVARARYGSRDAARDAFERAVILDPPSPIASRAWSQVEALDRLEDERPWTLAVGAGLAFDANVTRQEIDVDTNQADGVGRFELAGTYQLPTGELPDVELGYAFDQLLYFDATELDLQSHGLSAEVSERVGPLDTAFSYLYSLNRLDGDRFLDFHDIRTTAGFAPTESWYGTLSPAFQLKRFDQDSRRDAEQVTLGTLQLFALGGWHRYWLVGADAGLSDADGREFDLREVGAQAALHWPVPLGEGQLPLDLRYRFRFRDYRHDTPSIGREREDRIHSLRLRTDVPLRHRLWLRLEYEFEDSDSNLGSADYTDNVVSATLCYAM